MEERTLWGLPWEMVEGAIWIVAGAGSLLIAGDAIHKNGDYAIATMALGLLCLMFGVRYVVEGAKKEGTARKDCRCN